MAIEKTLNTRLKLRYDSHEKWIENDPKLLAGEVALCTVTVKQEGTANYVPSVLIKVGDGEHKYSELDFAYAKAADVVEAAKSETALTAFINGVIANAGIATDEAMQELAGRVETAEGEIDTLQFEMDAVETKASDNAAAIEVLQGLVGLDAGTVSEQISAAITELDLANTYDAKGAAATAEQNAKDHADGLNTAMNTRVEALEAIDHDHDNKAELDLIAAGDKAKWDAMEQNAKDYADGLNTAMDGRVADLEAMFGDGEGTVEAQIEAAVSAEAGLREAADTALGNRVKAIEDDYLKAADKTALQGEIDGLKGLVGTDAVSEQISTAVAAEAEIARAAEKANADAIKTKADQTALQAEIERATQAEAGLQTQINTIMNNPDAEGAINSINEFTQYIAEHGEVAEGFRTSIGENAQAIEDLAAEVARVDGNAVQADWGEQNPESPAYIKNKLIDYRVDKGSIYYCGYNAEDTIDESTGCYTLVCNEPFPYDPYDAYNWEHGPIEVEFKGKTYDNLSYQIESYQIFLGNKGVTGWGDDTGEPFLISISVSSDRTVRIWSKESFKSYTTDIRGNVKVSTKRLEDQFLSLKAQNVIERFEDTQSRAWNTAELVGRYSGEYPGTGLCKEVEDLKALVGTDAGTVSEQISSAIDTFETNKIVPMQEAIDALEEDTHTHDNKEVLDGIEAADVAAWDAKVDSVAAGTGLKATREGNAVTIAFDEDVIFVFDCGTSAE